MRAITGAIHAAAGNKAGVRSAQKFAFFKRKKTALVKESQVRSLLGDAEGEGEFTMEQIAAEAARLRGEQ